MPGSSAIEVSIEGKTYQCYRLSIDAEKEVETFIVAGFGKVSLLRSTGALVALSAVNAAHVPLLRRVALALAATLGDWSH